MSYNSSIEAWTFAFVPPWDIIEFEANGIEPRYNPGLGQQLDLSQNRPTGWSRINELQSYFGRATYSYQGKYMLTGTVRVDGSSKFGGNNKNGEGKASDKKLTAKKSAQKKTHRQKIKWVTKTQIVDSTQHR